MNTELKNRITEVNNRLAAACERAGRDPKEVRLVAVTKTMPAERVKEGVAAGLDLFGENYIQEAQDKIQAVGPGVSWHFIGRLQSNKAKYAVKLFDLIHSVDNLKLAREIAKRAQGVGRIQPVLVQVNIAEEETKGGVSLDQARELVDQVGELEGLELAGLMTMPPFFDQPERARPFFAALRELKEKIGPPLKELSMGMSGDFEVAVEEGATLVRIGTSIFGARQTA